MTHAELVTRAAAWLRNRHRCIVVLTEHTGSQERPDAIGWNRAGHTILVECKASKSDLARDRSKPWRRNPEMQHGRTRWYLLDPDAWERTREIATLDGWGVAWAERVVRVTREPVAAADWSPARDSIFLIRELQRFHLQGTKPLTYLEHRHTTEVGCRGTLGEVDEARRLMRIDGPPLTPSQERRP